MESNDQAKEWATNKALTEEEAFDYAVRSTNIKKENCEYMRGFDEGYKKGLEDAQQATLEKFNGILEENTEFRKQIKAMNDMITRLRECIARNNEMEYD